MLSFEEFTDALYEAGWRADCDAQHTEVVAVYDEMVSESRKAQQIAELRQQVSKLAEQLDVAVDALEKATKYIEGGFEIGEHYQTGRKALAAIKSNEVKE